MNPSTSTVTAGIDLGGTGTRIIIRGEEGTISTRTVPTVLFSNIEQSQRAGALASHVLELVPPGMTLVSLGIGASGPVDTDAGVITNKDTLECFSFFPLVEALRNHLQVKVSIDNDAVAAVLGEYHFGAGINSKRLLMVTLGTGIGVALLENGRPFRTSNGAHPEAGHIPISGNPAPCYCGLHGCWETLASRSWLQQNLESLLPGIAFEKQDLNFYREMAAQRDEVAALFHRYGNYLGRGLVTLLTLYGPDLTILSGSAAHYYPLFKTGLEQALTRSEAYAVNTLIVPSELGDVAGALGATVIPSLN
ncbi:MULTISPECIES: ROK family protein [Franconibacter]|uniref:Glucokinase n=2 Tax=Franconibacter TaxID=1649295 RepID=A0A0J8VPN6_9ENTR|nr:MULTISPECIES: ROK family protein [Franconibacter]KMV34912.1 glucokinase [Franconibacter pulveris]MCK1967986.1 ROK family protein [Franconibacter sp. IITDAS19]MEB5920544.1 ROK family protein [Franconibacter daqui]GGD16034.1 glucokinase [Franconibacter daqui]